ncbi:AAA family ATPase [Fusobacterium gastrosuis]|uniref:AAA family ATPase n=1 Tax=Fusobacterium gastrosuis TaxID=1755100 RepID=UPI002971430D|nr:AAA family ATPase [Fusobacteriaceae bacterium]MDY5714177.1 AAA family ATPase [Fusobacterium gastrosuis]
MSKKIPIGLSDFKEIIEDNYYYIDKTKLIDDLIKDGSKVKLFTRPRRFGKTLNMSMLSYFFDIVNADENRKLFKDLYIENTENFKYQGENPVIYISLKELKNKSYYDLVEDLKILISKLFYEYRGIIEKLDEFKAPIFKDYITRNSSENDLKNSLGFLSQVLYENYGKKAVIIIDEYDTPIVSAYEHGYYVDGISFFRTFLGAALKDNKYLQMGVMAGILRVAKEGIFSGLNNLAVYTILDNDYSNFFGLTEDEVEKTLVEYQIDYRIDDVKEWYDGYKFGDNEIYNPWSILNFLSNKTLESYWINTSDNFLIKKILNNTDDVLIEELTEIFNYQPLEKTIDKSSNMIDLNNKKEIWQLLLFSGYLTIQNKTETTADSYLLKIVNKEVYNFFKKTFIDNYLADESLFAKMMISLLDKDLKAFEQHLQKILLLSFSYYDGANEEKFYHNLILGMILYLDRRYKVHSNKEIGFGRYDIVLEPKNSNDIAYIFEFKVAKSSEELERKVNEALEQIKSQKYDVDLKEKGYNILNVGMAFCGKEVKVKYL